MAYQTEANDPLVRPVSRQQSGLVPRNPHRHRVGLAHQQHQGDPSGQGGGTMIRAYRLYTGPDGNSLVERGSISEGKLVEAQSITFKETPPRSSFDWHNDPIPQYVITLAGVLEFTTVGGETFTVHPGEVLLAEDNVGSGHKWRLINDEPWKRAYVIFREGANTQFVPNHT